MLERFLDVLESGPDAEPAVAPNHEELTHLLTAMIGAHPEPEPAAAA